MPVGTPYITPAMLVNKPTGVGWDDIPLPNSDSELVQAALMDVCWTATSIVDTYCNQVLRATVSNEPITGPGAARMGHQPGTRNGLLVMRRWPIIEVLAIQTTSNRSWPRSWTPIPSGNYEVEHPLINLYTDTASATGPDGGATIVVAPGYIPPLLGGRNRNAIQALVSYTNGWSHTSLTASANEGDTVLHVDDVTGWTGASGFVYDGSQTETVSVLSVAATTPLNLPNGIGTAQTGPGTITLSSPLANPHATGVCVSALPANAIWASALAATSQALEAGITSISIQNISGSVSEGGKGVEDVQTSYEWLLEPFVRRM